MLFLASEPLVIKLNLSNYIWEIKFNNNSIILHIYKVFGGTNVILIQKYYIKLIKIPINLVNFIMKNQFFYHFQCLFDSCEYEYFLKLLKNFQLKTHYTQSIQINNEIKKPKFQFSCNSFLKYIYIYQQNNIILTERSNQNDGFIHQILIFKINLSYIIQLFKTQEDNYRNREFKRRELKNKDIFQVSQNYDLKLNQKHFIEEKIDDDDDNEKLFQVSQNYDLKLNQKHFIEEKIDDDDDDNEKLFQVSQNYDSKLNQKHFIEEKIDDDEKLFQVSQNYDEKLFQTIEDYDLDLVPMLFIEVENNDDDDEKLLLNPPVTQKKD